MPVTLAHDPVTRSMVRRFLATIHAHRLFPFSSMEKVYWQRFSVGMYVSAEDIDQARIFAEGLRQRYGRHLRVTQHLATVFFGLHDEGLPEIPPF